MTTGLVAEKMAARATAYALRGALHAGASGKGRQAAAHALPAIAAVRGARVVSAYLPIRTEMDVKPTMLALLGLGYRLCVPVVEGRGRPLRFRAWRPDVKLERGSFGVEAPVEGDWLEPDALLVPLLAFDAGGWRLGYGGGFYDRTLADLRSRRQVVAIGFAFAGQQVEAVPRDATDARLDAVVTEAGVLRPS